MTAGQGPLRSPATEAYSTTLSSVSSALTTGPSSQDPCVALSVTQRPSAAVSASRATTGVRLPAEPCRAGPIGDFDSENGHHIDDPSEDALFDLISELNDADSTFTVIQQYRKRAGGLTEFLA